MQKITGTIINYYFVCHRKLWYFLHGIHMESNSQEVELGKLIDEYSYSDKKKHIMINETICVDFIGKYNIIHEVKRSRSIEKASEWQIKYYIYYFKQHGVLIQKGIIDYPRLKQKFEVIFSKEDENYIKKIVSDIKNINELKIPDVINSKICKKCAYFELCYV